MDIWNATDYRDFLAQVYEDRKSQNPRFSFRVWAARLQIDGPLLNRIIKKKQHLPLRFVDLLLKDLKLKGREAQVFKELVELSRAKGDRAKEDHLLKLLSLKDVKKNTLDQKQYHFFSDWFHTSLRCLIGALDGDETPQELSQKLIPKISAKQVKDSIQLQVQLGLLKKQMEKGKLKFNLTDTHLSTNAQEVHQAIRSYQKQMLERAIEAVDRFDKTERDFSTLTFAVDQECYEDIAEILKESRRRIQQRIEQSGQPMGVYHLNMNVFPTALIKEKKRGGKND